MWTRQKDKPKRISKRYLTWVGWCDVWHYPGALIASSFVVAGICLPLLLLIGLKRGLVEQFIKDIEKSPTAREIGLWVLQEKAVLTPTAIADLVRDQSGIEMVIPNIRKVVAARNVAGGTTGIDGLTLASTDTADPYLAAHKVVAPRGDERSLVLSRHAAEVLDVNVGDMLQLDVSRSEGGATGRGQINVKVKGILDTGSREASIGYAHWKLLQRIEEYQSGEAISEFGWPAFQMPMKPRYPYFLCFSRTALTTADEMRLKARGLCAECLPASDPNDRRRNLYGLLAGSVPEQVYMVRANTAAGSEAVQLSFTAGEIEGMLDTNVVAIPWSDPIDLDVGGGRRLVVGLTLRPRWLRDRFAMRDGWFENDESEYVAKIPTEGDPNKSPAAVVMHLSDDVAVSLSVKAVTPAVGRSDPGRPAATQAAKAVSPVQGAADPNKAMAPTKAGADPNSPAASQAVTAVPPATGTGDPNKGPSGSGPATALGGVGTPSDPKPDPNSRTAAVPDVNQVRSPGGVASGAAAGAPDPAKTPAGQAKVELAVVPAALLAHIHQLRNGAARFDKGTTMFIRPKSSVGYYQARVFAKTLDDVLVLHNELCKRFAVESNLTRILEMKDYGHTLKMLVNVVGSVVFIFGLVTVTSLLSDITARKKGDIGILSCMGISKWAAVYFVVIRATLIGIVGCFIAYLASLALSLVLDRGLGVRCAAPVYDLWWLLLFSIVCCWAGTIIPAIRAARLDPVRCLQEAKVR